MKIITVEITYIAQTRNGTDYVPYTYKVMCEGKENPLFVPLNPANIDYQIIQEWIAEGNTVIDNGANN